MSIFNFVRKFKEYSRYRKAIAELSILTDRELSDLGLTRCDIDQVARSSAGYVS